MRERTKPVRDEAKSIDSFMAEEQPKNSNGAESLSTSSNGAASKEASGNGAKAPATDDVNPQAMEKLLAWIDELSAQVTPLKQKIEEGTAESRKPRGVRISLKRLDDLICVLRAIRAIADIFMLGTQEYFNALNRGNILIEKKGRERAIKRLLNDMDGRTDAMLQALNDGDDDTADAEARELHSTALALEYHTEALADAIRIATHYFPTKHEQLQLFSDLTVYELPDVIECVDRTMHMGGHLEILVADAMQMMQATENGDKQAISTIVQRAAEYV